MDEKRSFTLDTLLETLNSLTIIKSARLIYKDLPNEA